MNQYDVLNKRINLVTSKIHEEYPELIKYLDEMPSHNLATPHKGLDAGDLIDYLNTLNELLETYQQKHI